VLKPMLAEDLAHFDRKPPWGSEDWAMEIKVDGIRLIWTNEDGGARYYARSGNEHTGRYPFLADLALPPNTMLDGELVVPKGMSSDACALVNRGELVYAERFTDGPYVIVNNGDLIKITPTITAD